jgi:hypothetical protein
MATLELAPGKSANDAAPEAPVETTVKAANEDTPSGGALYRLIARRPSKRIPATAVVATLFCLGAMAAYVWGFYGLPGIEGLTRQDMVIIGATALVPVLLIWLAAYTIWRGQEMRLMAEALARTAIRLTDPADAASGEIATIASAVRAELDNMKAGLAEALAETTRLKALVAEELEAIESGSARAETRTGRMEDLVTRHHDSLTELGRMLGQESDTISRGLRQQVDAVRGLIGEAQSTLQSAGAATRAIGATIDELRTATSALSEDVTRAATEAIATTTDDLRIATNAMTSEVNRAAAALTNDVSARAQELRGLVTHAVSENDVAAERFNAAMIRLGGTAREAGNALHTAASELEVRIAHMPQEAAASTASMTQVLQEQVAALAAIADIVVRHARVLDRSTPQPAAQSMTPMPIPAPPPRPEPAPVVAQATRRWGMSELLAAAGRSHERAAEAPPQASPGAESDGEFQRSSLQVIETLQALAIDLDRALEQSPPPDLWQRYQAGERNVFTRRLYNISGRQLYDRIAVKYRGEAEFRENVDRFVDLFERLLASASARDRDNILVETYLTSDTGKVYLMLAQASGRLA